MIVYDRTSRTLNIDGKDQQKTAAMPYSGHGDGLNNIEMEDVVGVGPIPQGVWSIGPWHNHPHLGPLVAALTPKVVKNLYGRGAFFIHGDNSSRNHTASDGCIILDYNLRLAIANSGETEITVT